MGTSARARERILPIVTTALSSVGRVRRVLAGDLLEPADRRRAATQSLRRHAGAEDLPAREPARSPDVLDDERTRGRAVAQQDRSGKYSPIEVAQWLQDLADGVMQDLSSINGTGSPAIRRVVIDATIQAGLGRFFAAKFRAGVLYAIHERTGDRRALDETLAGYGDARRAWAEISEQARTVYAADLSASDKLSERGQWLDRLQGIDDDIERIAERRASSKPCRRRNRRGRYYPGARPSPPRSRAVHAHSARLLSRRSRAAASAEAHRAQTHRRTSSATTAM